MKPPFPSVIDNSMRSAFVSCMRQGYYAHFLYLRKNEISIHLHFGKCVAAGLEATRRAYYEHGKDAIAAIGIGCAAIIHEWGDFELPDYLSRTRAGIKTLPAALDALVSYFEYYKLNEDIITPLMIDSRTMVEVSAALPIPDLYHPQTGQPILYCGRFDMLGTHNSGSLYIVDEKTTSAIGDKWNDQWQLRAQFTGYMWLTTQFGLRVRSAIVRGIGIMSGSIVVGPKAEATMFRPEWQVDDWLRQLQRDVRRWIAAWEAMPDDEITAHREWDQALDSACTSYGGCGYVPLCNCDHPPALYSDYIVSKWNPLERTIETA